MPWSTMRSAPEAEQMGDGEAMDHSGGVVHLPVRAFVSGLRRERPRVLIQREEAASRIERWTLEELEEGAGVVDQPQPVGRQRREARRPGRWKFLDRRLPHYAPPSCVRRRRVYRRVVGLTRWVSRPAGESLASRVWVFLGAGRLTAKTPVFGGWKSLDFLGFSSESSLFNGLHGIFAEKNFSRPFARGGGSTADRRQCCLTCRNADC